MKINLSLKWNFKNKSPTILLKVSDSSIEPILWHSDSIKGEEKVLKEYKVPFNKRPSKVYITLFQSNGKLFEKKLKNQTFTLSEGSRFRFVFKYSNKFVMVVNIETKKVIPVSINVGSNYPFSDGYDTSSRNILHESGVSNPIVITKRVGFGNTTKTLLSCFNFSKKINFTDEYYYRLKEYILDYYSIVDGDTELDYKKCMMDFLLWAPTRIYNYVHDVGDGEYLRPYYPLKFGDCEDLMLCVFDFHKALISHKFLRESKFFTNLQYHALTYYSCFAVVTSKDDAIQSQTKTKRTKRTKRTKTPTFIPAHAIALMVKKDPLQSHFKPVKSYFRKGVEFDPPVLLGECISIISPFLDYSPVIKEDTALVDDLQYENRGFRYLRHGKNAYKFYKKVYQITCPEFIRDFGVSTLKCIYNGKDGVPFKKFMTLNRVTFLPLEKITKTHYQYAKYESLGNLPLPTKEFCHFGSAPKSVILREKAKEFVKSIGVKFNSAKKKDIGAVGYFSVEDLGDTYYQNILKRVLTRRNYKISFKQMDLFPDREYNKMTTFRAIIFRTNLKK